MLAANTHRSNQNQHSDEHMRSQNKAGNTENNPTKTSKRKSV